MRWISIVGVGLAMGGICVAIGQTTKPKADASNNFMRAKLEHSQKVLEGLAVDDLPLVAKHSDELSLLSKAASWQVLQTPEYVRRSKEFQRAAEAVASAAKKKNLDGAALAYLDLTMKCIDCHKYVRNVRMVNWEPRETPLKVASLSSAD
jgi:hypothetical protein